MSELMPLPPIDESGGESHAAEAKDVKRVPTVYFIDDSATMREVIKIAFRRENVNVIACADAAAALAQFEQHRPDVVITDVIMPDQDGYSVCTHIKQHPDLSTTPVVLMSGVVNKNVADKAVAVHADELIRKPFQPQELISRVKALLNPKVAPATPFAQDPSASSRALSHLFAPPPPASRPAFLPHGGGGYSDAPARSAPWSNALADALAPRPSEPFGQSAAPSAPNASPTAGGPHLANPLSPSFVQPAAPFEQNPAARPAGAPIDVQKLRLEIARLDLLVKKLQTELQIERQYNQALESQIRAFTESA